MTASVASRGARRTLLLLLTLSLLPIAIGGGLYVFGWRPQTTSNHGQLILPPVALADPQLRGKWTLLLVDASAADDRLDALRRVRAVLAKEWRRTQHLRLAAPPPPFGAVADGTVIIVDPQGMAMMRYEPGADAKGISADLQQLLKYSWIG